MRSVNFSNSFAKLPSSFYTKQAPELMPDAKVVSISASAASLVGQSAESITKDSSWLAMLSGGKPLEGADPLAAVYAGHQFGHWAGRLGDGRALLLGEMQFEDSRIELQLKGSGPTPYSRRADGHAVLRSSIREYLCSEAMHGLSIPTTRALSLMASDRVVIRESYETSAMVCRLAPSFVRFGSFEYFCHFNRHDDLKVLADYVIAKFFPACLSAANSYFAFLTEVTQATARMVAHWQSVGFCHGVMNTDNMSILGLTLDYGPFGFLDAFDEEHICNHTDELGRYSYKNQPRIAHWNCYCLANALMPLIGEAELAEKALDTFTGAYETSFRQLMRNKLGIFASAAASNVFNDMNDMNEEDDKLIAATFQLMQANHADFTLFFRHLATVETSDACRDLMLDWNNFDAWKHRYTERLSKTKVTASERHAKMQAVNPLYVLRNHVAEIAIQKARGDTGSPDFSEVNRVLKALENPFHERGEFADLAALPPDWAQSLSVSCSS